MLKQILRDIVRILLVYLCLTFVTKETCGYGFGRCPKYPSMPKFNMSRVLGHWYEVERSFYLPEIASGCTTFEFQPYNKAELSKFNNFKLEVAIKTINRITGNPNVNLGYATPENSRSSIMDFKFNTRFPEVIARLLPGSGKYQVLYTDYENFAILWSCGSIGSLGYSDQIWILGRERDFLVDIRSKIYDVLKRLSLDPERLAAVIYWRNDDVKYTNQKVKRICEKLQANSSTTWGFLEMMASMMLMMGLAIMMNILIDLQ